MVKIVCQLEKEMPQKPFTTIRVYDEDKEVLIDRYGGPAHEAFNKAMTETCPHPEESRSYVQANLPMPDQDAITSGSPRRAVGGFYCSVCDKYVFPKVRTGQPE